MNGCHDIGSQGGFQKFTTLLRYPEFRAKQRLSGSRAEGDDHGWFNKSYLGLQPGATRGNFYGVGFLVNPTLPPRLPLEMFHHIRDVGQRAIDSGLLKSAIE